MRAPMVWGGLGVVGLVCPLVGFAFWTPLTSQERQFGAFQELQLQPVVRGRSSATTSGPTSWCWSLSPNRPVFGEIAGDVSRCWPGFTPFRPTMAVRSCAGFAANHAPGWCKKRCGGFCFGDASWVPPGTTGAFLASVFVHGCFCGTS